MKKRVVVAMSGGVDSSVAAALLKEGGFEVIGVTMELQERSQDWGGCCDIASVEDAKRVAYRLKIPHYVLNFRDIFKEKVIANFCAEYKEGRTPNPCIRCNQYIKFDALLKKADELSADYIATGHYARIEYDNQRKRCLLKKGIDSRKDQSYVLYVMTQEQLKRTLMPLGYFTKNQVRQIAREKDLPVAGKSESQEICFIPDNNYGKFLMEHTSDGFKPGAIINNEGKVIGKHQGIIFYTIGQRKRIGISASAPLYVIGIDNESNTIIVGNKEDAYSGELVADNVNLIFYEAIKEPMKVEAKIRYNHKAAPATVSTLDRNKLKLKFDSPQWAITPGQAVVFYLSSPDKSLLHPTEPVGSNSHKDIVIGGGTIIPKKDYK